MRPLQRLGGFKILKDVVWASVIGPADDETLPARLCRTLAGEGVNLAFLTVGGSGHPPGANFVVDVQDVPKVREVLDREFDIQNAAMGEAAVFSLFPHKSDPLVMGSLLEAFGQKGIHPLALANSHSAISVVVDRESCEAGVSALFSRFNFSAYRTPADWKLAQKGKETLYREVVASYQEKRPKVYALELYESQELWDVRFTAGRMTRMETAFKTIGESGRFLTFLISSPVSRDVYHFVFCLPATDPHPGDTTENVLKEDIWARRAPVTVFSMNGPHFGDRYGIVRDLLEALNGARVNLLGLSCSIASISGVLLAGQVDGAVAAIKGCFEVPSILVRT
ncbi:MAG: hypothetical protein R6U38_10145 [Desulfatiglandaceae bacterium]